MKFQLRCSCITCRKEITVQSLKPHYNSHVSKSKCPECKNDIFNYNKFCSRKCSANYTSREKDFTKIKSGPAKGFRKGISPNPPKTKVYPCKVCNKFFKTNNAKTCSEDCRSILSRLSLAKTVEAGFDVNKNRGRGKRSYLEVSFAAWLLENFPDLLVEQEKPFNRYHDKDYLKTYYCDFYFPNLNLVIELDGSQHQQTKNYDDERDEYICKTYGISIFRITHKEYKEQSRINEVIALLKLGEKC